MREVVCGLVLKKDQVSVSVVLRQHSGSSPYLPVIATVGEIFIYSLLNLGQVLRPHKGLTCIRPLSCGFDSSVGRALHQYRRGRGFAPRSEPDFFAGLCFSSVTAAFAFITVSAFNCYCWTNIYLLNNFNGNIKTLFTCCTYSCTTGRPGHANSHSGQTWGACAAPAKTFAY